MWRDRFAKQFVGLVVVSENGVDNPNDDFEPDFPSLGAKVVSDFACNTSVNIQNLCFFVRWVAKSKKKELLGCKVLRAYRSKLCRCIELRKSKSSVWEFPLPTFAFHLRWKVLVFCQDRASIFDTSQLQVLLFVPPFILIYLVPLNSNKVSKVVVNYLNW